VSRRVEVEVPRRRQEPAAPAWLKRSPDGRNPAIIQVAVSLQFAERVARVMDAYTKAVPDKDGGGANALLAGALGSTIDSLEKRLALAEVLPASMDTKRMRHAAKQIAGVLPEVRETIMERGRQLASELDVHLRILALVLLHWDRMRRMRPEEKS